MSGTSDRARRKRRLLSLYGGRCFWCGKQMKVTPRAPTDRVTANEMTVDELVPVSRGGRRRLDNQVPAHRICNERRGAMIASASDIERHQTTLAAALAQESA